MIRKVDVLLIVSAEIREVSVLLITSAGIRAIKGIDRKKPVFYSYT